MSSASELAGFSSPISVKNYLILIVDDSETDRFIYRRALKAGVAMGDIAECDCGETALEHCSHQRPDLILLDYGLPDMDGLELMQYLAEQLGTCPPVILLTGQGSEQIAVDAMKAGAKDYLIKGQLKPEKLVQAVTSVLTEYRLRAKIQQQQRQRELMSTVALQVSRATELPQVLQVAAEGARALLKCDRTILYRFEPDMSGTVVAESVLPKWTPIKGLKLEDNCFQGEHSHQAEKYRRGHKMVVPDIESDSMADCHRQMLQQFQVKANFVVPILRGAVPAAAPQLWGLLIAHHCQASHDWQPDELMLLDELTLQVAIAIQQAELVTGLKAGLEKQRAIDHQLLERANELERANQLLAEAMHTLGQRNQELDEFAYIVSHDLKAPLRGISNLSQWLVDDLQDQLPEENQQQLDLIQNRVLRMEKLIDGILQYSRAGKQVLEKEPVDVQRLLLEVIDSLSPPQTFSIQLPETLPQLETQRLLLQQVFANLIGNAIKYHDRADGRVSVALEDQGEDFIQFTVADDGPGIDPEHHQRIFSIFQTLSSGEQAKGTGIGLTIIKKIVEQQGGLVWVESSVGQGSAFSFTWPRTLA